MIHRGLRGILEKIPVISGDIVAPLNFMVIKSLPYDLVIGSPTLVCMCACIHLDRQAVKVRKDENTENFNLIYGPEMYKVKEEELTTDKESDVGEGSNKYEYSALILTLRDVTESLFVEKDVDQVEEKVANLSEEYAAEVKHILI